MEKEIASAKADNSLIEEEIIKVLDQIDEIQKRIVQEKELLRVEELKIAEEKKNIDADKKIKEANYAEIDIRRKAFAESINKSILARYDRILHNKDGLAMVPVISDACGGCNMNLPPQVVNEAKLMQDLTFCGNCARILYSIE